MTVNEIVITKAIIDRFSQKFMEYTEVDTAIVGAGPSGLIAAYFLAKAGQKVAIFERELSIGGGMWGGGMMFNEIVVQTEAKELLEMFGISIREYEPGYYTADAVECVTTICSNALKAGAKIFNCMSVEDVIIREDRVTGLVLTWSAVETAGMHVDPLSIAAHYVIDATGHATEVIRLIEKKTDIALNTETGKIMGERSMWAEKAEQLTLENTKEICPGVWVSGMAANAAFGGPRMGPIFGGMLLSGKKVAELIIPKEESAFDTSAEDFDVWFRNNQAIFESELLAQKYFIADPEHSLSIGCGTGIFDERLGITLGVEPSEEMAKIARKRGMKIDVGTAENIPYEDETVKTVLLGTNLSYVKDRKKAITEAYRILQPGGNIVVSFLTREGSYAMLYDLSSLRGEYDPEAAPKDPYPLKFVKGTHWCSVSEVTNLLQEAGFVDLKYVQTLTHHPKYSNEEIEQPQDGYDKGDYIVVQGRKS
ncbi:MAG: thiazole biosynthesis protein [Deltaproteobacteria bacterium]|nr:thiazole biosynthesis protein [Deltaproteobacteria bacterium]